ncbi:Zn-binding domain-containing protein [Escherichia coli]
MNYDTVPGELVLLKELMRTPDNLLKLLELAYQAIVECSCNNDTHKDGCYRCVYAYRDRGRMKYVSRDRRVSCWRKFCRQEIRYWVIDSIKNISLEAMMGSELEKRFISCLQENKNLIVSSQSRASGRWVDY